MPLSWGEDLLKVCEEVDGWKLGWRGSYYIIFICMKLSGIEKVIIKRQQNSQLVCPLEKSISWIKIVIKFENAREGF